MEKSYMFRILVALNVGFLVIITFITKRLPGEKPKHYHVPPDVEKFVYDVAVSLKRAKIHARGMKNQKEIAFIIRKMDELLKLRNTSFDLVARRKSFSYKYVCPEKFTTIEHDFPRYEQNYLLQDCSYKQPIASFLTVAMVFTTDESSVIEKLIQSINSTYANISIIVGIVSNNDVIKRNQYKAVLNIDVKTFTPGTSVGKIWNSLVGNVNTEFVLVGRDIRHFSNDSNLHRLVREIQRLNVISIGGSTINGENRWHIGCHQRAFRNYSLVFQEGYDESFHDCLFCDHLDGPFVIRTKDIKSVKFDENLRAMGLFEDLFLRLGGESAICADSMFYVRSLKRSKNVADWKAFGNKRNLYKLTFSSGPIIIFGCSGKYSCPKQTGYTNSPCCMQELTKLVNDVDRECLEHKILCEINCGNLLGAVKLNTALPWEIDGDSRFYAGNFTAFKNLKNVFVNMGYSFKSVGSSNPSGCSPGLNFPKQRGVFQIASAHWDLTLYSFCYSSSEKSLSQGLNLTFVANNGHYAIAPRNPALYIRNKYAFEPFAHAQHYFVTGKRFTDTFTPSSFTNCKTPYRHDCLDLYNTDGNIQFQDPIP